MSDKAVHRTAPATPGLLNRVGRYGSKLHQSCMIGLRERELVSPVRGIFGNILAIYPFSCGPFLGINLGPLRKNYVFFLHICCQPSTLCCQQSSFNCQQSILKGPWSTVNCHLSTVICQLSPVICQLSPVICQLLTVNCQKT